MIAGPLRRLRHQTSDLLDSSLFDDHTFYSAFMQDLSKCKEEALIESPYLTVRRVNSLSPILRKLTARRVSVIVNTREPSEHEERMRIEAVDGIKLLQDAGVQVLFTSGHHRKLAILNRRILWEGSLNILSQNDSCEVMRRIESEQLAIQMIDFIRLNSFMT